jgi:DNA-binding CsgD family transcriptional regulator
MQWNHASPRGKSKQIKSLGSKSRLHRGVHVKVIRRNEQTNLNVSRASVPRELYFFYEKNTGVSHFHVEAGPDGQFPVEQAAGLLAMHCLVRGQSPRDYVVMVQAAPDALEGLAEKAEQLLQAGHSVGSSVKLTRREEEVLGGVMRSLANKEIAASLNLSERTVKFHVSSLLAKFRVRGRMELVREAARHTASPMAASQQPVAPRETRPSVPPPHAYSQVARNIGPIALTKRQLLA